nr:WD40 repeat-containing protein [Tanacetum cinerariifolium]
MVPGACWEVMEGRGGIVRNSGLGQKTGEVELQVVAGKTGEQCLFKLGGKRQVSAYKEFKEFVKVQYRDNKGVIVRIKKVKVEFSWKPAKCNHYNVFGHNFTICKARPKTKEEMVKLQEEKERNKAMADNFVPIRNQGQNDKLMIEECITVI